MNKKAIVKILIFVACIATGLYLGLYWAFITGIAQGVDQIKLGSELSGMIIAWSIVKVFILAPILAYFPIGTGIIIISEY